MTPFDGFVGDDDWALIEKLSVGGQNWSVELPSGGDTITGPTAPPDADPITGLIYPAKRPAMLVVQPGATAVAKTEWHLIVRSGSVALNAVLTSQATPVLRFRVTSLPEQGGQPLQVERC